MYCHPPGPVYRKSAARSAALRNGKFPETGRNRQLRGRITVRSSRPPGDVQSPEQGGCARKMLADVTEDMETEGVISVNQPV